jgi:hypothetical protein
LALLAGMIALAAAAAQAEMPASLDAAKTLAAQKNLPLLVKFASEY